MSRLKIEVLERDLAFYEKQLTECQAQLIIEPENKILRQDIVRIRAANKKRRAKIEFLRGNINGK